MSLTDDLYDDDDTDAPDDAAPIDMLCAYFDAHGWSHEHVSDDEIVATTQGSWASYELRAVWRAEDQVLQLLVFPDVRVIDDKRAAIYETISLINEQLWLGHFEMWSSSGILLFRHGLLIGDGETLNLAAAETVVESAIDECERFYPVFQFVLWGGKSPKDAIAAALIETRGEA